MSVFIDTSVIMYAAGRAHHHRDACRAVLTQVASGELAGVTSVEVVQEILHRFARGDRDVGARMAQGVLDLFGDLLPVDRQVIGATVARYRSDAGLSARDAIHVATCEVHAITELVSVDTDFDDIEGLTRIDPHALADGSEAP